MFRYHQMFTFLSAGRTIGQLSGRLNAGTQAFLPVRPAGMLAAAPGFSGVELRWAHRLKVYVPVSPDVHLLIRRAYHRTIIRQIERWNTGIPACAPSGHVGRCSRFQRSRTPLGPQTESLCSGITKCSPSYPPGAPSDNSPAD